MKNVLIRLLAFVCTASIAAAAFAQNAQRDIVRAAQPVRGQYIVLLDGNDDPQAVGLETATLFGGRLDHVYERAVRGFAIRLPEAAAAQLANDPRVRLVEEDGIVSINDVQAAPPWGLDRIDQRALPLDGIYSYRDGATPVYVHVIDTGIRTSHLDFGGRAIVGGDYITPSTGGQDCHGHGTHVAGTIGGATFGVAKHVTLVAQRALDCTGTGPYSSIIAALDAVAADTLHRPAIANMSLGGPASSALDDAVRGTIASGVTVVVAAGNSNIDASTRSPARVVEAVTVGAVDSRDTRASFSNFGSVLDLFAPGVSVLSDWVTSDAATATLSGTSMAAPHVAGAAALLLELNANQTPAQVATALTAAATAGIVIGAGTGSPNRLLYSAPGPSSAPSITVTQPNGGEKLFTATPYTIAWTASDPDGLARFDVLVSTNGGVSYSPVAGCTALPGTARECVWASPGAAASSASIKISARDAGGNAGEDVSNAPFSIVDGAASITVTSPNTAVNWGRGSMQTITWSHNLGAMSYVTIELSRDGGVTFPEVLASSVKNAAASAGSFNWRVTGPNTGSALVRVRWTAGPAADVGNVAFTVADPYIKLTQPYASSTSWGYATSQATQWTTNLGPLDTVRILLSTDGGTTFPLTLADGAKASAQSTYVTVPTLSVATTAARLRVLWTNPPSGESVNGTSPVNFRVEPPYVIVSAPNGGEAWTVGTTATVRWAGNLGNARVNIYLSIDDGATYPVTLAANSLNDSVENVGVLAAWLTATARVRVTWTSDATITDTSNAAFTIR